MAEDYGFFEGTLWDLEENKSLRELRVRPAVLAENDQVVIPALCAKSVTAHTGARHVFRRRGIPAKYRVRVATQGRAVANAPFMFAIDGGDPISGTTDANGAIEIWLPPGALRGELYVPSARLRACVRFGMLDPIGLDRGVQQRLVNLGYLRGEADGVIDERTRGAIAAFQRAQGLTVTGTCDADTRTALEAAHEPAT